jgi:Tol biopolymer transport system component
MPQPNPISSFKITYAICVAELLILILGPAEVCLAQGATAPEKGITQKLVYQVQTFNGGGDLLYGLPGGTRPATSDIYEQSGPNVGAKQLLQWGEAPAWSPGGDKIAFLGFTKISTAQHSQAMPEFSRQDNVPPPQQGTVIVRDAWRIEGTSLLARQIYVMNADGSGVKRITSVSNGVWDFAWSPTQDKIAYCEQGKDDQTAIVVIDLDGERRQELTKMGEIRCAVGMPVLHKTLDKSKTMTSSKPGAGKVLIKLVGPIEHTAGDEVVTGELVGVPTLAWSPDGKLIAFTGVISGKPVIGVVDMGGKTRPLGVGYSPRWSPDGKQLLFRHDSNNVSALCVMNADGTEPRKILDNESAEFGFSWFPDGKSIAFGSQRDAKKWSEIFRVNTGGGGLQKIATQPNMSLSNPIVSPDGMKLIVEGLTEPTSGESLVLIDLATHHQESLGKGSHASVLWQRP